MTFTAYGIDADLQTVEHGPVTLADALEMLRECLGFAGVRFETAEESLAKTHLGFAKESAQFNDHFIEIDLVANTMFDVRHERSKTFLKFFSTGFNESARLGSFSELGMLVSAYFNSDDDAFMARWKSLPGRKTA